ncbi:DUF6880 family protein [Candidatus Bipolaricaulota sp. J31]
MRDREIFADPEGTVQELAALGAVRLAEELVRLAYRSDVALESVLRLLSTSEENLERFRKGLARIRRGRKFYDWERAGELADELEALLEDLKAADPSPEEALEHLAQFFRSDGKVLARCDDSSGYVGSVFTGEATGLFAEFARRCRDKAWVADLVFRLYLEDEYGTREGLLRHATEFLPEENVRALVERLWEWAQTSPENAYHALTGVDLLARGLRDPRLLERAVLAQYEIPPPRILLYIAEAYLEADEPEGALEWVERLPSALEPWVEDDRDDLLYRIYERLGKREELAKVAWRIFRRHRSKDSLEKLLHAVGEDQREHIVAQEVKEILSSGRFSYSDISFLIDLGRLEEAEAMLLRHTKELDGDRYNTLLPWARALEQGGYPLGATVVYRALLESILSRAQSKYYHHGARYLRKLDSLAEGISDWRGLTPHEEYKRALREAHKRKYRFWEKYEGNKK